MALPLNALNDRLRQIPSVRAVLLLSLVMIVATVISAAAVLVDLRHKELAHGQGEIVTLTQVLAEQTARTIESVALTMRSARERLGDDIGRHFELDSHAVHLLLRARVAGLPQIESLFLIDRDGNGINSSRPDFVPGFPMRAPGLFRHFVAHAGDGLLISPPEQAPDDGHWIYYIGMRLDALDGQLRGVLVAAINIDYFETLYDSIKLDFVSRIQLLNGDGVLLAGKPRDATQFGKRFADPAVLAQVLARPPTGTIVVTDETAAGRQYIAYREVADYPLIVASAIGEDDALTPWRHVMRPIAASALLVVLCVVLTSVLMVRDLLRKAALDAALKESDAQRRRELLETNRQLQELSASLQSVREQERTAVARELHDELGQMLTGIRMEVSWLGGHLPGEQQVLVDKVASIKGQIDQTITSVRRMSSELRPLVLDDLGFAAAAAWYVDQFAERTGLPVSLTLPQVDPPRGDTVATALFRVLQESLTNVARHAAAHHVEVVLGFADAHWILSIRDDGDGFVHDRGRPGGVGLVGMRERAQILGGQFSVTSAPGAGTLIEVRIPAQQEER